MCSIYSGNLVYSMKNGSKFGLFQPVTIGKAGEVICGVSLEIQIIVGRLPMLSFGNETLGCCAASDLFNRSLVPMIASSMLIVRAYYVLILVFVPVVGHR